MVQSLGAGAASFPHLANKGRDTRISCTWLQATAARAAFIEESRMRLMKAAKLHRKSGVWGTRIGGRGREFITDFSCRRQVGSSG
jgi:hypothetical protein